MFPALLGLHDAPAAPDTLGDAKMRAPAFPAQMPVSFALDVQTGSRESG